MEISHYENIGSVDRAFRLTIGLTMAVAPVALTLNPGFIALIAIASSYPLITALTAYDPFVGILHSIKWRPKPLNRITPSATA